MTRPTPEQRDTLAAEIVMQAGVRVWSSASPLERATLVLNHCVDAGIDASAVTPLQLSTAMGCMPLNAQSIHSYGDMACALAAVLPSVQPGSVNAELLDALQSLFAVIDCSGIPGSRGSPLEKARAAIAKATQVRP